MLDGTFLAREGNPISFQSLNAKGIATGGMLRLRTVVRTRDCQRSFKRCLYGKGSLLLRLQHEWHMIRSRVCNWCS